MKFDEIDIKILKENFDEHTINKLNMENISKIFIYLKNNGTFYAKDLFLSSLDLFLLPYEEFKNRFEYLKIFNAR